VKHLSIFESYEPLDKKDLDLLKRILDNSESWRKILKEVSEKPNSDKFDRLIQHFRVLKFIQNKPKEMSSLIAPVLKDNPMLMKWISANADNLPADFRESVGLYSDLKNLGF